jgi:hypothetical protein
MIHTLPRAVLGALRHAHDALRDAAGASGAISLN